MAAEAEMGSVYLEHQLSQGRSTKRKQGSLIERLRHRNSHRRSWTDSIKYVRSFVAERKMQIENTEPSGVQRCLDTLQKVMKVKSQQTLKERLDLIGRHLGLSRQIQDQKVSLGTDAFQVDVVLDDGGNIANVKLANQESVVDCPDLKDVLRNGDFTEFIEHLQGLQSVYDVTNDEKLKSKAFLALQALEKDLNQLAQFQSSINGVANYVHKCPLGIMLPRLAGKPMRLIYFVSPYDLLDKKSLAAHPLTVEAIKENFLGQSVNVCIEAVPDSAPANKLQTMPLMNANKTQDGQSSFPSFSAVSKMNSMMLPASFVLVLPQSVPVSMLVLQKITSQTNLEIHSEADVQSLRSLIIQSFSGGSIKDCRRLFVSLPDQQHIYFLDCLKGESEDHQGLMLSRIPFTHPNHVPQILNLLRQQLLFNIVIGSCVRPGAKRESDNSIVFEVAAVSLHNLTIVFEHPAYDSMITVDIDLSDITSLKCRVACTNMDQTLCSDEAISRIFHRCMSIPIMLRWLVRQGCGQLDRLKEAADKERCEKLSFLRELQKQQAKLQSVTVPADRPPPQPPHPPPVPPPPNYSHHRHHSPSHLSLNFSNGQTPVTDPSLPEARSILAGIEELCNVAENSIKHVNDSYLTSPDSEHVHSSILATLLDEDEISGAGGQKEVHDSPMLSRLLDDRTSVATTVTPMNCQPGATTSAKRRRKRKSQSEFRGPSSKQHHVSDTGCLGPLGSSMDLDIGAGVMEQSLHSSSVLLGSLAPGCVRHRSHPAQAVHSQANIIDLTDDSSVGDLSLRKLPNSVGKHSVYKAESDLSMLLNEAEAQSRILLQNSPSSKNENATTSLEGNLRGSGEVGRANDFDPSDAAHVPSSTGFSKLSSLLLASSDSLSHLNMSQLKATSVFLSENFANNEFLGANLGKSSGCVFAQDIQATPLAQSKELCQSSNIQSPSDKKSITGIFEKFDISGQQKSMTLQVKNNEVKLQHAEYTRNNEVKLQSGEGKVSLRLRVGRLKRHNSLKSNAKSFLSVDEADLTYGKSNNIGTFDFKSDEDDDGGLLMQFSSERYVCSSSSPTCLEISSHKHLNEHSSFPQKSDKTKTKHRNSGNATKRKREKEGSKRDKKRRKSVHFIPESLYGTVESDAKVDFKLKIRVAKRPLVNKSDSFSDGQVSDYEITKRLVISSQDKLRPGQEVRESLPNVGDAAREKDTGSTDKTFINKSLHKLPPKSGTCKVPSGTGNRADPKLVTKATIRLKPLMLPNLASTVNIGHSGPKTSSSSSASKTHRRGSISAITAHPERCPSVNNSVLERRNSTLNLVNRRNTSQLPSMSGMPSSTALTLTVCTAATTPATPVPANLSVSALLPNAPTISKIASLPRIPKLSSSLSSTSINRTSSLDHSSRSNSTSSRTKTTSSYAFGPSRRSSASSGPSGSRSSAGGSTTFNHNNHTTAPGSCAAVSSCSNTNKPSGPTRRHSGLQSSQAMSQRPAGPSAGVQSSQAMSRRPAGPSAGVQSSQAVSQRPAGPSAGVQSSQAVSRRPAGPSAGVQSSQAVSRRPAGPSTGVQSSQAVSRRPVGPSAGVQSSQAVSRRPAGPSAGVQSSQAVSRRPVGPSSGGNSHQARTNSSSHRHSCNSMRSTVKVSVGSLSSSGAPQKTPGGAAKTNNSAKLGSHFMGHSSSGNVSRQKSSCDMVSGQRNVTQNANTSFSTQTVSSSFSVRRSSHSGKSPNITNSGKSPNITNSGKSPNITNSGKSPNITNSGKSPNITNSGKSPNITNSGKSLNITNSGKSINFTNSEKSPNITSFSRSPNINSCSKSPSMSATSKSSNSTSSYRSPNINLSRSANRSSSSAKPATNPSPSGKHPVIVSHRLSPALTKYSDENRSIMKKHPSYTSQKSSRNTSGSIKSATSKARMKTMSVSETVQQQKDEFLPVSAGNDGLSISVGSFDPGVAGAGVSVAGVSVAGAGVSGAGVSVAGVGVSVAGAGVSVADAGVSVAGVDMNDSSVGSGISVCTNHSGVSVSSAGSVVSVSSAGPVVSVSSAGPVVSVSSAGPIVSVSSAGPVVSVSSAGPVVSVSSAGPVVSVSSAVPGISFSSVGPVVSVSSAVPGISFSSVGPIVSVSSAGPVVSISSAGPIVSVSSAGPIVSVSSAGPVVSVSSAGPVVSVSSAGPIVSVSSTGPIVSVSSTGPIVSVSSTGPIVSVSSFDPIVSVSSAGPIVSDSSAGPIVSDSSAGTDINVTVVCPSFSVGSTGTDICVSKSDVSVPSACFSLGRADPSVSSCSETVSVDTSSHAESVIVIAKPAQELELVQPVSLSTTSALLPSSSSSFSDLEPQTTTVASTRTSSPLLSPDTESFLQVHYNKGSKPKHLMSETFSPSAPNMSQSTDSAKMKCLVSKGRKNSLSAIVDKLKHNAVGGVLDSSAVLCSLAEAPKYTNTGTCLGLEAHKLTVLTSDNVGKQETREASSPPSTSDVQTKGNSRSEDGKCNHQLACDLVTPACDESSVSSVGVSSDKCLPESAALLSEMCSHQNKIDKRSQETSVKTETSFQVCSLNEASHLKTADINKVKDKPSTLKTPSVARPFVPSQPKLAITSCDTSTSLLSLPFQCQQPPVSSKSVRRIAEISSKIKDGGGEVFKIPSVSPLDHQKESKVFIQAHDLKNDRWDSVGCTAPRERHERGPPGEQASCSVGSRTSSSKSFPSPVSDRSGPENGLTIDGDVDVPLLSSKSSNKICNSNIMSKAQSPKSSSSKNCKDRTVNPLSSFVCTSVTVSLRPSPQPSAVSSQSGRSADSPCPIDDDLMDMALGCDS